MFKEFLNVANEEKSQYLEVNCDVPNFYNTFAKKFFRVFVRQ